jgi:hypothetical protein
MAAAEPSAAIRSKREATIPERKRVDSSTGGLRWRSVAPVRPAIDRIAIVRAPPSAVASLACIGHVVGSLKGFPDAQ